MNIPKSVKEAASQEAAFFNGQVAFVPAKKHPAAMQLTINGQQRKMPVSLSDRKKQVDWVRQDVRRMANAILRCA